MDFTVITPNLNYARYLDDCLESVASQQGVTLEHLLLDGGSTDESEMIAAKYPHVTWQQRQDSGMSQAINRGFDQACGEWVMWLNADDRLRPGVLAALLSQLQDTAADIVYGDFHFVDEDGREIRRVRLPGWSPFVHVHHHCYIGSTAAFYRRKTILDAGHRLREDFRYVMDGEFYARLHAAGMRFQHVSASLADFRLHGGNASMRHLGRTQDLDQILAAEKQHIESRAIRRAHGVTLFTDPYLNGGVDAILWVAAKAWKGVLKTIS